MRKIYLLCIALFLSVSLFAQDRNDQAMILQECIDLPEMQKAYGDEQLHVILSNDKVNRELVVTGSGNTYIFMNEAQLGWQKVDAFFQFSELNVYGQVATVKGKFIYEYTKSEQKEITMEVDLNKINDMWQVKKSVIKQL